MIRFCLSVLAIAAMVCGSVGDPAKANHRGREFLAGVNSFFNGLGEEINRITKGTTRTVVRFPRRYEKGEIVISTAERRLYFVVARGTAFRYTVGVGREGYKWSGVSTVSRKAEWPSWRPPEEMKERQPDLPDYMPGGLDNPLGARALYLFEGDKDTLYRIHGTREKHTIGTDISSGCIRMLNNDVIDLYNRVRIGAKVYVYR